MSKPLKWVRSEGCSAYDGYIFYRVEYTSLPRITVRPNGFYLRPILAGLTTPEIEHLIAGPFDTLEAAQFAAELIGEDYALKP